MVRDLCRPTKGIIDVANQDTESGLAFLLSSVGHAEVKITFCTRLAKG